MVNKIKRDRRLPTLGAALGLLAAREGRSLLRALAMRKKRQEGIHAARKCCRRLRSLLRLLPSEQPTDAVNRRLQELARGLAPLRDAHIATSTAKLLAATHETWITSEVIQALEHRCEQILDHALHEDPNWRQRRVQAQRIVASMGALAWVDIRPSQARKTLKHSKRRVKKAHHKTRTSRTPEAMHRWRRRARKLRYQLEFVRKARRMAGMKKRRTQQYGAWAKQLSALTDQLGWRQDFRIFRDAVGQLPASPDVRALRRQLPSKSANWSQAEPHA